MWEDLGFLEYGNMHNPSAQAVSAVGYPINNIFNYHSSCCCMFIVNCRLLAAPQSVSCSVDRAEALMRPVRLSLQWMSRLRLSSSTLPEGTHTRVEKL